MVRNERTKDSASKGDKENERSQIVVSPCVTGLDECGENKTSAGLKKPPILVESRPLPSVPGFHTFLTRSGTKNEHLSTKT